MTCLAICSISMCENAPTNLYVQRFWCLVISGSNTSFQRTSWTPMIYSSTSLKSDLNVKISYNCSCENANIKLVKCLFTTYLYVFIYVCYNYILHNIYYAILQYYTILIILSISVWDYKFANNLYLSWGSNQMRILECFSMLWDYTKRFISMSISIWRTIYDIIGMIR